MRYCGAFGIQEVQQRVCLCVSNGDEQYCVLGEFFLHADGDLLLLRATEETIYYYAHTNDEVRVLCKDMDELVEKILKKYISNS